MKRLAREGPVTATADWETRIHLELPNNRVLKIHAAHNFKGHSKYNPLHGLQVEAMESGAEHDILVAGHHHNWGFSQYEHQKNGRVYTILRARGFKANGEYEVTGGFADYQNGHTMMTVIDPSKTGPGFVTTFADPLSGETYLRALRREWRADHK